MSVKTGTILSGDLAIVNQILPHRHKWAWELFLKGQANNWSPAEVTMSKDVEQWHSDKITEDERLLLKRCLGFFAGSESLVSNNLLLNIFRLVGDAECRQYLFRQAFEEALHNQTIVYICDSLGLEINEVYEAYSSIPSIKAKDDFLIQITTDTNRAGFSLNSIDGKQEALRNIITYYMVCEGVFFYSGFAMLLTFGRHNKMPGVSEQIQYTLRDESLHLQFGTNLVNTIVSQEPAVWTKDFKEETVEHFRKATELEIAYSDDILPTGVLGMNSALFVEYVRYITNRRLESIGLPRLFKNPKNPFGWMAEIIDLPKQKNFFETKVTEYQTGGLIDDL